MDRSERSSREAQRRPSAAESHDRAVSGAALRDLSPRGEALNALAAVAQRRELPGGFASARPAGAVMATGAKALILSPGVHPGAAAAPIQRVATAAGVCYFNGEKPLFTLSGQDGLFVKAAQQARPGFTTYKKVVKAEGQGPQGQDKYKLADPPVTIDEDDRTPQQKWTDAVGGGSFGDAFFVLPGSSYPHLSVAYTLDKGRITFGDAHYSRSQDDSRRLSYKRSADGWTYEVETQGVGHAEAKQAADALIGRMTKAL